MVSPPWTINFYEFATGASPVGDFMDELRFSEERLHRQCLKRMVFLTDKDLWSVTTDNVLEDIGGGLWELKFHLPKTELRLLGCITYEAGTATFHALVAFKKKSQKLRNRYIKLARNRKAVFDREH